MLQNGDGPVRHAICLCPHLVGLLLQLQLLIVVWALTNVAHSINAIALQQAQHQRKQRQQQQQQTATSTTATTIADKKQELKALLAGLQRCKYPDFFLFTLKE